MLRALFKTSSFLLLLKMTRKIYRFMEGWVDRIYKESQTHRLIKISWEGINVNFRYSLLGKITEINNKDNLVILSNSKFVKWFLGVYKTCGERAISYLRINIVTSTVMGWIGEAKKELYFLSVKTSSIILVTIISTNIFFSILLSREIGLLGWIIRMSFLFVGLAGLFCNARWKDIMRTSYFIRKMNIL